MSCYLWPGGRTGTPAAFRIFKTVVRPSINSPAPCRLDCPDSYASTTTARSRAVTRRR